SAAGSASARSTSSRARADASKSSARSYQAQYLLALKHDVAEAETDLATSKADGRSGPPRQLRDVVFDELALLGETGDVANPLWYGRMPRFQFVDPFHQTHFFNASSSRGTPSAMFGNRTPLSARLMRTQAPLDGPARSVQ